MMILTADIDAVVKSHRNLRVHFDQKLLFPSQLVVAVNDLTLDPCAE